MGELPLEAQAKLLRVLQEREFERVGGTRTIASEARVIAATNRDLAALVAAGRFRADLYYRLNVFPLQLPALRERRDDIPLLARHFLGKLARRLGRPLAGFTAESERRLCDHDWPGNVRELENVVERAAILSDGPLLDVGFMDGRASRRGWRRRRDARHARARQHRRRPGARGLEGDRPPRGGRRAGHAPEHPALPHAAAWASAAPLRA